MEFINVKPCSEQRHIWKGFQSCSAEQVLQYDQGEKYIETWICQFHVTLPCIQRNWRSFTVIRLKILQRWLKGKTGYPEKTAEWETLKIYLLNQRQTDVLEHLKSYYNMDQVINNMHFIHPSSMFNFTLLCCHNCVETS